MPQLLHLTFGQDNYDFALCVEFTVREVMIMLYMANRR